MFLPTQEASNLEYFTRELQRAKGLMQKWSLQSNRKRLAAADRRHSALSSAIRARDWDKATTTSNTYDPRSRVS